VRYPCFDIKKLDDCFQTECYLKNDEIFIATHIPMTFRIKPRGQQSYQQASEEELIPLICKGWSGVLEYRGQLERVEPRFPTMQIVLIRGYTGTGKTELCRYIEFSLKNEEFFKEKITHARTITGQALKEYLEMREKIDCIRIERGHLSAIGALSIPLAIESKGQSNLITSKIRELSRYIKKAFYSFLSIRARTDPSFYYDLIPHLDELLRDEEVFTSIIADNIDAHINQLKNIEASRKEKLVTLNLITRDDLEKLGVNVDTEEIEKINGGLLEALSHLLFRGGITSALEAYIKEANNRGRYPVIIMDDLSLVNRINLRQIFDFLTGIAGARFRCSVVIGMTTGVFLGEISKIRSDTLTPRMHEIDLSERDSNITEWLTENKTMNFIERYLKLIRNKKCPEECKRPCWSISKDLYPFNRSFILRLRRCLQDTELGLTPRGIISALYEILTSKEPAYRAIDNYFRNQRARSYEPLAGLSEEIKKRWEDLALACYWYGRVTEKYFQIDKNIIDALGLLPQDDTSTGQIIIDDEKIKIPVQFGTIGEEEEEEKEEDRELLLKDLLNITRWIKGENLSPTTEYNLERILLKTLEAVSEEDLRIILKKTSYRPEAWLAWRYGDKPKIIFSLTGDPPVGEPCLVFTPSDLKVKHPLVLKISEDGLKQLIQDYHRGYVISERFIELNLWKLKSLCANYRKALKKYLESHMGVKIEKYLFSAILFLDSILNGNFIPNTRKDMVSRLKEILKSPEEIENKALKSLETALPEDYKKIFTLPLLVKLYKGFVLLRRSIIDIQELCRNAPSNKEELLKILRECKTQVPKGFRIETKNKSYEFRVTLEIIKELLTKVTSETINFEEIKKQAQNWEKKVNKLDPNIKSKLTEALRELKEIYGQTKNFSLKLLSNDCEKLLEICPKQDDVNELSKMLEKVHNINMLKNDTEEAFVVNKIYLDVKSSYVTKFLEKLEKWIEDLNDEVKGFTEPQSFLNHIEKLLTEMSNTLRLRR